ncbi:hypothetical protein N7537_005714 [Penicillium hordei]|uniref:Uncharacterized protein n=1 Tax=Penicillium hordei TaxID=40994 RepID=A0AAD6E689_9EURO|nr:uncharacterized protein N7537_005714 [Penicillium hordei]KAJ5602758.1 hypothetical protein N7537_005714 [Penicillium hordei]
MEIGIAVCTNGCLIWLGMTRMSDPCRSEAKHRTLPFNLRATPSNREKRGKSPNVGAESVNPTTY